MVYGKKSGEGKVYWPNGRVCYTGEFMFDSPCGKDLKMYGSEGKVIKELRNGEQWKGLF